VSQSSWGAYGKDAVIKGRREEKLKKRKTEDRRAVDKNPTGVEINEEEENSDWSTVNRRNSRKGKRTSLLMLN
jgi:hypothetical protein